MAGYYHICPSISLSGLSGHAGILWGQKSDDFGLFCSAMYFNSSNQVELSGNSSTVYSTSGDHLFSVQSPSGVALLIKADDSTDDITRPEMTLYGDLSVTGCIYGTFADTYVSAGTFDNSTNCITLTRSDDCTVDVDISNYCHSNLAGIVADQHVAHSNVNINTGTGLCGGGNIASSRTLSLSGQAETLHNLTVNNSSLIAKDSGGTFVSISSSSFVDVTGDTITGDLIVEGDLTVQGTTTTLNTEVCTTSAMEITNAGTGPALVVNQTGSQPVVDFQDDCTSVFYIEDGGNVGIGTSDPNAKLTVAGVISSNNTIWSGSYNSSNWTEAYNNYICDVSVTGTGTKTVTLTQNDGGTITTTFTDKDTIYTGWSLSASDTSGTFNIASGCTGSFCGGAGIDVCRVDNEIKVINTITNNNQLGNGCNFTTLTCTLTSLSVGAEGTPAGDGSLAYNNTTGVFTYTPPVINDSTITISAGTDLSTGGSFTLNQSSGSTITINHDDITRTNSTSTASPAHGGTFTAIDSITSSARGHITAVNTKTVTLPAGYTGWNLYTDTTDRGTITDGEQVRFCGGTDISLGYTATNNVITINHDTVSSTSSHSGCSVGYGGTFTVVCALSATSQGHTCCVGTMTITLPASDENDTTYDISASSTTGGANLNLNAGGSGSGTDSVKLASGTGITVSFTDASTITINHPTQTAITCNCSNGTVLQDISINNCGHVTSVGYYNLDNRYYTETEVDTCFSTCLGNYLLNTTDTLTGNLTITGNLIGCGDVIAGYGGGGVSLTTNDGYGNANITFNHRNGTPEQAGNSGRIEVNTDSCGNACMSFELCSNVACGVALQTDSILTLCSSSIIMHKTTCMCGCVVATKLVDTNDTACCVDPSGTSNLKDINLTGGDLLFYPDTSGDGAQFDYYAGRLYIGNCAGSSWHMAIEDSGNVGIGTTDPDEKLHVAGDIRVGIGGSSDYNRIEFTRAGGAVVGGMGWHSDNYFYVAGHPSVGATAGNIVRVYGFGSDIRLGDSVNGDVLTIDNTYGNVGIGITAPGSSYKLDVFGGLRVYQNTSSAGAGMGLTVENDGTGDAIVQYLLSATRRWVTGIDNSDSDKFKIASSADLDSDAHVTIQTDGNVGIGTTTPSSKFHVVGESNLVGKTNILSTSTDGILRVGGGGNSTNSGNLVQMSFGFNGTLSYEHYIATRHNAGTTTNNAFDFYTSDGTSSGTYPTNAVHNLTLNGGQVGIGLTDPSSALHIEKSLTGDSSQLRITNGAGATVRMGITGSGANDNAHIKTNSGEDLEFQIGQAADAATPSVIFKSGGNVGIGLTNPSNKLHVSGAVCATGNICGAVLYSGGAQVCTSVPSGYSGWDVSDGTTSETIASGDTLYFCGEQNASTLYCASENRLYIYGPSTGPIDSGCTTLVTGDTVYSTLTAYALTSHSHSYATTTASGFVELATAAEVTAGTGTSRVITPSSLTSITKLGTIATGTWQGTAIADSYIASASSWNTCATSSHTHDDRYYTESEVDTLLSGKDNYVNWSLYTGCTFRANIGSGNNVNFIGGSNVTVTYGTGSGNCDVTISATDTNTTYSAGTGLSLVGTQFSISSTCQTAIANGATAYGWGNHATAGYTTCTGDITTVAAGTGLAGGGTTGCVTLCHGATSSVSDLATGPSGNRRYIKSMNFDSYGHVESYTCNYIGFYQYNTNCLRMDFGDSTVMDVAICAGSGISITSNSGIQINNLCASDYRLKSNLKCYDTGYDIVKSVNTYQYQLNYQDQTSCETGMIAHELQCGGVIHGVTGEKDQVNDKNEPVYQCVSYSALVPTLWSALKTAINKIEDLEDRLATLELQSNT